jgi:glucose dehydrogenase
MNRVAVVSALAALLGAAALAQTGSGAGRDWTYHLGDQGGTRFSTLTQINTSNVARLTRAWTFHTGSGRFAGSPMVVDSVMYFSAPNGVYAVDAVTGRQIWKYAPQAPGEAAGGGGGALGRGTVNSAGTAIRGPVYWPGANGAAPRIYSTTSEGLAAIDAKSGTLVAGFGDNGVLPGVRPSSPPVIYRNVLIAQGGPDGANGSTVKGWDVLTGRRLWTFHL